MCLPLNLDNPSSKSSMAELNNVSLNKAIRGRF